MNAEDIEIGQSYWFQTGPHVTLRVTVTALPDIAGLCSCEDQGGNEIACEVSKFIGPTNATFSPQQ